MQADRQTKSEIIRQHHVWCPAAEETCKNKWIAGNDALKALYAPSQSAAEEW